MPAVPTPLAGGGHDVIMHEDTVTGQRRPPTETSSPNPKGKREAQQSKKRVKQTVPIPGESSQAGGSAEKVGADRQQTIPPAGTKTPAWGDGKGAARRLFSEAPRSEMWYIADSDSEDVMASIREDGLEHDGEGEGDPKCPAIHYTAAEERMFCRQWRSALVVKALGRTVSYTMMLKRLQSIWEKAGSIQVTSVKKGYFLVRFTSGIDYERALTGGPWLVGDNYLTVHPWTKDFNPYEHEISSTLVWARLLELPIHYFHPVAVMRIGERIGKPMRVDHATLSGARSDYARVCVQVDLTRPLLSQFTIHGKKYFIQYEGLDKICLQCGTYFECIRCSCMGRNEEMEVEEPAATPTRTEPKQPDTVYGEWMIAKKKRGLAGRPQSRKGDAKKSGEIRYKRGKDKMGLDLMYRRWKR
ncbi:unnamed protein product [Linum trigynum]|uniref:DUF4283 domain-containing protein n=2 Tax=Linum trigynum TaxID=586398 RepID=A0AAV2DBP9_9ROSI